MAQSMIPIGTITTTSGVASIIFDNISQSYQDLVLIGDVIGNNSVVSMSINDGTLNNGNVANVKTNSAVSNVFASGTSTEMNNTFTSRKTRFQVDILNYSATNTFKTLISRGGAGQSSGTGRFHDRIRRYSSNSAITKLTITNGTTMTAGATFTLYGVKA